MDLEQQKQMALDILAGLDRKPVATKKVASAKACKDCEPGTARPAPFPGPRCATHNREFKRAQKNRNHGKYVERTYGISPAVWQKLLEYQNGICPICERANGRTRRLSTDHDHACCAGPTSCGDCVRGLLCRPCNDMFGHGRDNIEFFKRAIAYLENPPYKRMLSENDGCIPEVE